VIGVPVVLKAGQSHDADSSDNAFQAAAIEAFREVYRKAKPQILEPIMKVSVEGPVEYSGNVFATINQRRGIIVSSVEDGAFTRVDAEVPLSEMFGYSSQLRSLTQGKAEFTMEFLKYGRVPVAVSEELIAAYQEKRRQENA
jgi:elongation factor G